MEKRLFTSESVTEGHPDKICDAVSDAVLDALMEQDPFSRVACETCTNTGFVLVMGEITTKANIDIPAIVRKTVTEIGYDSSEKGFDGNTCAVMVSLDKQSTDIAMGVDKALEAKESHMTDEQLDAIGAGDQGMMFGYATDDVPNQGGYFRSFRLSLLHVRDSLCQNGLNMIIAQRIVYCFSVFSTLDQPRLLQKTKLMRYRGLAHVQQRCNIADTQLRGNERRQYPQAGLVGKRFEKI